MSGVGARGFWPVSQTREDALQPSMHRMEQTGKAIALLGSVREENFQGNRLPQTGHPDRQPQEAQGLS